MPGLHEDMIRAGPLDPQHVTSFQQLPNAHEQRKKKTSWFENGERGL